MTVRIAEILSIKNNITTLNTFLAEKEDGQMEFTNDNGENYILVRKDERLTLTYPKNDFTGDPMVVMAFNALDF